MIKLLDCTLRDGGYVNDWKFGKSAIKDIKENLELSGVEIIELGFIKNEPKNKNRTVFNNIDDVKKLINKKVQNRQYAVMAEVINPLPLDMLAPYDKDAPEIIRVIVWKRMLKEGFEYCKGIVEKGYKLCIQPARVSQYSDDEFVEMIKMFNKLNPMAVYIVDSWGTMYKDDLLHYLKLADENLKKDISVGCHGHNNMMQAFDVACAFCEQNLKRDLIIDSSVYGIGRGAGNLNTELFAKWADEKLNKNYDIEPLFKIYDKYIKKIYKREKWGYSIPYLITAKYNANPNFAAYYEKKRLNNKIIEKCISTITKEERVIFKKEIADKYMAKIIKKKKVNTIFSFFQNRYSSRISVTKENKKNLNYEKHCDCFKLTENVKSNLLYDGAGVKSPFITVFIPTYKRLDLLKDALESVLNQEPVNFEWDILIVDNEPYDGAANETENYIKELHSNKITYYRNDENLRPGDNFNRGIFLAKAPWVMMLHDDDLLIPNAIKKMSNAITFLNAQKGKPLGAIATRAFQFKYDPAYPQKHMPLLEFVSTKILEEKMSYKFFKLTHANVLFTGHIGGSVPSNGALFNKNAVIETGGFNDDLGISADLILYFCMENKYSVYSTTEPYGFYRWGINQMSKFENAYKTVKDNYDFREYVFSKNLFTKIWGIMFRSSLYYNFTKCVLSMRSTVTTNQTDFEDYAQIYNKKPNLLMYMLWKKIIYRSYCIAMGMHKQILKMKSKKFIETEKINAANF